MSDGRTINHHSQSSDDSPELSQDEENVAVAEAVMKGEES